MKRKIVLFVFFLILSACAPTATQTADVQTTEEISILTETPEPQISEVVTGFQENTKYFELPEWVKISPYGGLLVLPYRDDIDRPTRAIFVNPENGETFIINLEKEFYYYYWRDNDHIIFFHGLSCNETPEFISELNVYTGVLQKYLAKDHPEFILNCYFDPDDEIVRLNREYSELAVEFVDPSNGNVSLLTDPNDGITDISIEQSYNAYVAVVQFKGDFEFSEHWQPEYGNQISIIDIRTKRIVLQYYEEQGILSEVSFIDYSNLVYMRENTPCLIMILSLVKNCIHKIPNQFPNSTIILSKNSELDFERIRFLYFSEEQGGYCFYHILSGGLGCPTDSFEVFENQIVTNYSFSSGGHYLLLEYDSKGCPRPWCDNFDNPKLALIDLHDGELFEIGFANDFFINPFLMPLQPNPWRPWL